MLGIFKKNESVSDEIKDNQEAIKEIIKLTIEKIDFNVTALNMTNFAIRMHSKINNIEEISFSEELEELKKISEKIKNKLIEFDEKI
jgi:hypothetical protein